MNPRVTMRLDRETLEILQQILETDDKFDKNRSKFIRHLILEYARQTSGEELQEDGKVTIKLVSPMREFVDFLANRYGKESWEKACLYLMDKGMDSLNLEELKTRVQVLEEIAEPVKITEKTQRELLKK